MFYKDIQKIFGPDLTDSDWSEIKASAAREGFYHAMRFSDGMAWTGHYDLDKVLHHYHLPARFDGKTILDVGPADGYFSFLAERGGASRVLAIQPGAAYPGFSYAHRKLKSKVEFSPTSIYNLNAISSDADQFDYVFCFSVLLHLPELLTALSGLFKATRECAFIATVIDEQSDSSSAKNTPNVLFVGERHAGLASSSFCNYWFPNTAAFTKMLHFVGFKTVDALDYFYLSESRTPPRKTNYHGVFRCSV